MKLKIVVVVLAVLLYVPAGLLGADYIAGAMVYVTNKRVPEDVSLSTWPEAWQAYREDATQRKRLRFEAVLAHFTLFGLLDSLGLYLTDRAKLLLVVARFASQCEIACV